MLPSTRLRDYHMLPVSHAPSPDVQLIRPLLNTPRADIEAYCSEHHLETRFDRSNLDTTFFRNRLRHEVLPYLAQINPRIAERLRTLSVVVQADYDLLHEFVSIAWDTLLVKACADMFSFNLAGWREQPLSIQRALIRRAAYKLCHELRDVSFVHIEEAVRLAQHGVTGTQATLPHGMRLTVGYTTLTIAQEQALHLPPELPWLAPGVALPLEVSSKVALPNGWHLHVQDVPHWNLDAIAKNVNPLVAWIDADAFGAAPVLRTRQRGDRFQPQGMGGSTARLSDLLINTKVPKSWRDHVPLLEADGHILWVVGVRLSERALVHPETQRTVYLRFHGVQAQSQNICAAHSN
jgi:tRNA(Ile)-lysidine synthase